jgi:hypothetical protein
MENGRAEGREDSAEVAIQTQPAVFTVKAVAVKKIEGA